MSVPDVTLETANVAVAIKALNDGNADEFEVLFEVSEMLAYHEAFAQPFLARYGVELHRTLVSESILAHHGQFVKDGRPGIFAVKLLSLAQNGQLSLRFDDQSRIHSLLFESPHLSFRK